MNAGLLPYALLCAALGLALYATPVRDAWWAVGILACTALLTDIVALPQQLDRIVWLGLWASTACIAALVHLPRGLSKFWAAMTAMVAGFWLGLAASIGGGWQTLLLALPLVLIFLPAGWLGANGKGIGVKIVASWIVAISLLAGMVNMIPTPGYQPDHMS